MNPTQYTSPILVTADGSLTNTTRIPFVADPSGNGFDEAWLQDLLFRCPQALPCEELDPAFGTLIPLCRELMTPAGPIDLVYVTPHGRLVVVETKLWRNSQARREVVAQVLDYAKELTRWETEDLERQVSTASNGRVRSIFDLVRDQPGALDEAAFNDQVSRTLKTGQFLLLIVGDGIKEGVGALTEFLDSYGSLQFTFGLIEVAVFDVPGVGRLVQPRVLAKTVIVKRTVVTLRQDGTATVNDDTAPDASEGPSPERAAKNRETAEFYRKFWSGLLNDLRLDDASQPVAKVTTGTNIFFAMPPSGSVAWVSAYVSLSQKRVGVYLTFTRGAFAEAAWNDLRTQREQIEQEIGDTLGWDDEGESKYYISANAPFNDVTQPDTQASVKEFFRTRINAFVNAFRPRLERLVTRM